MSSSASERLISVIQIEAFAHATEDPSKVRATILNLAPNMESEIIQQNLKGHFDNPILILRLKADSRENVESILTALKSLLNSTSKMALADELEQHLDEKGNLYLRFDKQELYQGRLLLSDGDDVVKVRLALTPHLLRRYRVDEVYRLCGLTV